MTTQNRIKKDYSLKDLLDLTKRDIFLTLNCHAIATVQTFDPTTQKVTASFNYKQTFMRVDAVTGKYVPIAVDYPAVIDCPIISLFGGNFSLRFPIAQGDTCLLLFNDRDMDQWTHSGQIVEPEDLRAHSISDAIALIGLKPFNRPLTDYDSDAVELTDGNSTLHLDTEKSTLEFSDTLIRLKAKIHLANSFTDLKTVLDDILDTLVSAFNAPTPSPGSPINPAAATALTVIKTLEVGGLLE